MVEESLHGPHAIVARLVFDLGQPETAMTGGAKFANRLRKPFEVQCELRAPRLTISGSSDSSDTPLTR